MGIVDDIGELDETWDKVLEIEDFVDAVIRVHARILVLKLFIAV